MSGAPDGAALWFTIPGPAALVNATATRVPWYPVPTPGCTMTVALVSGLGATVAQISASPACVLLRLSSVHVSPDPLTVAVCDDDDGPSSATKAIRSSLSAEVENVGVVMVPTPSTKTCLSIPIKLAGCELSTVTETGEEVPMPPKESVAVAVIECVPALYVSVSQKVLYGGAVTGEPTAVPSM